MWLTCLHWTQLVLIHMSSSLGSQPSKYDVDGCLHQGSHQTTQNRGSKLNIRTGRKLEYFLKICFKNYTVHVFSLLFRNILIPPLSIILDKSRLLTRTSQTLSPSGPLPSAMHILYLSLLMALVQGGRICTNPKV